MTRRFDDEETLADAVAHGDADALAFCVGSLSSPVPYARGRAAQLLAGAPEPWFGAATRDALTATATSAMWWRALGDFAELHRRFPHGLDEGLLRPALSRASSDADALYQALRAIDHAGVAWGHDAARPFDAHDDVDVALMANAIVAGPPSPGAAARLRGERGPRRTEAMLLLAQRGDRAALPPLVALLTRSGPFAFAILEAVEEAAAIELAPALRSVWNRRWLADPLAARAAAAATTLGDASALARLRAFADARRRDLRGVALAELARVGAAEDRAAVVRRLRDPVERTAAFVLAELWRSPHLDVWAAVLDALGSDDADRQLAACASCGQRPLDAETSERLGAVLHSTRSDVRAAAATALAAATGLAAATRLSPRTPGAPYASTAGAPTPPRPSHP